MTVTTVVAVFVVVACVSLPLTGAGTDKCWSTPVKPYLITHPCYATKCRCNNYTLDCSSNFGDLLYVPRVFEGVQVLNFSNNKLGKIADDRFFTNVSDHVWMLDLYNNGLTYISPGVFVGLRKLTALLIGGNNLNYLNLDPVFNIPTLKRLDIKCGGLGLMPSNVFTKVAMRKELEYLDLSWNHLGLNGTLDLSAFQPLKQLYSLALWDNDIYWLRTAQLPSLGEIQFHKNRLYIFPATCKNGTRESLFPNLRTLRLDFNVIASIQDPVCLPKLLLLNLQYNQIVHFPTNMFSQLRFPALETLLLTEMHNAIRQIEAFTFNNSALYHIDLGYNDVDFSGTVVSEAAFDGCTRLQHLSLRNNNFQHVSDDRFQRLLGRLTSLTSLYVSYGYIGEISRNTFAKFRKMERLYLYGNSLSVIPDGAFDQLRELTTLSLGNNRISTISSGVFSKEIQTRLQTLDLAGNPFECGCDILWFQNWLKTNPSKFENFDHEGYRCANVNNKTVKEFYISDQACILSRMESTLTIVFSSLAILFFATFSLCFGYRWHCRLWLYEVCRGREGKRHHRSAIWPARRFRYDLFVAYAEEDVDWVLEELLPVLEGQWGLRLCIHQRDFIPGKHIIDNISDCVDESDRIMMVFSPHFARSEWCQFELKMCQTCVMDRDDVLVLVTLQETVSRDLTGAMLAVMRTTTYIEWDDSPSARASFWGRLRIALQDVLQNVVSLIES